MITDYDRRAFLLLIDDEDGLAGLPDFVRDAMEAAADERGHAVTLPRPVNEPVLKFSERPICSGDGYSAGYYSCMWSEVLDADAFAAFGEADDPFDPETAAKLKANIYSAGGSRDPEYAYTRFRGRMPTAEAMLKDRDLV